ncbi:MAG: ATP-binding protein [Clostridiales bacterium]|nr:ATP-binding protein [Clostridiales bacterium]
MIFDYGRFRGELEKINDWWLTNRVREARLYALKRKHFGTLIQQLEQPRISLLAGPRRAGKSVLLKQAIQELIQTGRNSRNILYYSLDDPSLSAYSDNVMKDLLDYFLENIAVEGKKYVFFDEVHLFDDWYRWMKSFYDRRQDIKFVITGSSSLNLQRDANAFLRGRMDEIEMFPLDFHEFARFYGFDPPAISIDELDVWDEHEIRRVRNDFQEVFREYIVVGGFPEWFEVKKQREAKLRWFSLLVNDIPKKAIFEDIATLYNIRNPKILEQVFAFIAAHQSRILSYETVNDVAKLDRATLINYIEFLKASYLIVEVLKFAGIKEQLKAKKKYLIVDQGLRNAVLKEYEVREDNAGFILENVVGLHLYFSGREKGRKLYYIRVNVDGEVDFVWAEEEGKKNREVIPVEVKFQARIEKKDIKNILRFMDKEDLRMAYVITKDVYKKEEVGGRALHFVPAEVFLLGSTSD